MKTIIYDPDKGLAIPDGHVVEWVDALVDDMDNPSQPTISNVLVVNAIRAAISNGDIACNRLQIVTPDGVVKFDKWGRAKPWPNCWDVGESFLQKLV